MDYEGIAFNATVTDHLTAIASAARFVAMYDDAMRTAQSMAETERMHACMTSAREQLSTLDAELGAFLRSAPKTVDGESIATMARMMARTMVWQAYKV